MAFSSQGMQPTRHFRRAAALLGVLLVGVILCGCSAETSTASGPAAAGQERGKGAVAEVENSPPVSTAAAPVAIPPGEPAVSAQPLDESLPEGKAAALRLEPFGKFLWRDTLQEAIAKARQIDGATNVDVILLHRRLPAAQFDGPGRLERWLKGLFAESTAYRTQFLRTPPALPRPYYDVGAQIEAKPLSLVGVNFLLKVTFISEPGLIVADPQQVRRQSQEFFGANAADDAPLLLSQVELLPSGVVSPEAHREIIDTLLAKYGPLRVKNPSGVDLGQSYLGLTFRDASDNTLDLYPGGRLFYRNGEVHREQGSLAERFREHQHTFEEQQRKGRAEKKSGTLNDL
ncbi:MAG: hypothetical protein AB7U20_00400 [Planctomycetaceae bacterium]